MSDSLDDPFIFDLIDHFGGDGYLVYFGTVTLLAKEFDEKTTDFYWFSLKFLSKKFQVSAKKFQKVVKFCSSFEKFILKYDENDATRIGIKCPKLLELADEWTIKKLRSNSGATPKNLRHEEDIDIEEDIEEDYLKKNTKRKKSKNKKCPYEKIINAYHERLPNNPQVIETTEALKAQIRARWRDGHQELEWWEWYFSYISESDFLTGKKGDWIASLQWLTGSKNMTKVLNGNFINRGHNTGSKLGDKNAQVCEDFINGR